VEDPVLPGSALPDSTALPGFKTSGYILMEAIRRPGPIERESVLIEWTDTDPSNTTFEGTAREIMRVQLNNRIHPMGDFVFNPEAHPGDADFRVMYISCGDGGAGEARTSIRSNPQRLDTLVGKILRIIPEVDDRKDSSVLSDNTRYRIPNDDPFVSKPGARKEIWAYGLRNPSRLSWDGDRLIANLIGLHTWETVVFIHKGANYGYSLREGNQTLDAENKLGPLPEDDRIPVRINETITDGMTAPTYPVVQYGHVKGGGDAIGSGYVYHGKAVPALHGKYIFADISTGNIWWADYQEMLTADSGNTRKMAAMHPVQVLRDGEVYGSMAPITDSVYHAGGGKASGLPGIAAVSGGRSGIHFTIDVDGELYILSKSDMVIRAVVGATVK